MRPETRVSENRPSRLTRTTFLAADYFSDLLGALERIAFNRLHSQRP